MTAAVKQLAEIDAMFFQVVGYWPDRPRLDRVLVAKSRELAEVLLEADQVPGTVDTVSLMSQAARARIWSA